MESIGYRTTGERLLEPAGPEQVWRRRRLGVTTSRIRAWQGLDAEHVWRKDASAECEGNIAHNL